MWEPIPEDHISRWPYLPGDWCFDFAAAALARMAERGRLTKSCWDDIRSAGSSPTEQKREHIDEEAGMRRACEWADVFRKLEELDGYTQQQIKDVMRFAFSGECWWFEAGNLRSIAALRRKTKSGDTKFDCIYQDMKTHDESSTKKRQPPTAEEQRERARRAREIAFGQAA